VLPVLLQFHFPEFLGSFHWIEGLVWGTVILGLYLWRQRKPYFSLNGFLFWLGMLALMRGMIYYAGPGYHFKLHTYGVAIAAGFVVGIYLAARQARREGMSTDVVLDMAFWILISSMVGSRVLFIIVNIDDYMAEPLNLLKVWQGGLVFYGGFIGALLAAFYYTQKKGINFLRVADIMVPSVAIGHTFGRLGCFSAGCCHGMPTGSESFGLIFTHGGSVVARNKLLGVPLHPTQLYESFGELVIFFILISLRKKKRFHGQLLIAYLILYPILRSINEMFRGDYERGMLFRVDLFGSEAPDILSTSQFISLILASIGVGLLVSMLWRKKHPKKTAPTEVIEAESE